MGGCISSPAPPGSEVSDRDRALHRQAEKALKEAKAKMNVQVKVPLLGSGNSRKRTTYQAAKLPGIYPSVFPLLPLSSF
ncbi:hypothetical protein DFH06DRAFT_1205405 [Mycena polygramma]|nr:hypothetical protein DFH06DRAFT_1205405 [Mycena polygramma]